jgi:hypothetical protein
MRKQLTAVGIDYAPFFTERTCESIQFEVRRFCNGHTKFRCEEPYIQQKVYLAIHRAVGVGRYRLEIICRDGNVTSPQTFAKGIMRMRMAHMHCDLLEERHGRPPVAAPIEPPEAASINADVVSAGLAMADDSGYAGIEAGRADPPLAAADVVSARLATAHNLREAVWPPPLAAAMEADTVSDPRPTPFEALDDQERQDKIDTAVASMAPDVRAAWNGLAYDGISWSELGRREGLSDNGARRRYKPKFLDAFLAVGLDEYYGGPSRPASIEPTVSAIIKLAFGQQQIGKDSRITRSSIAVDRVDAVWKPTLSAKGVKYGQK